MILGARGRGGRGGFLLDLELALQHQRQQHHEPDRQRGQRAARERQVDPHRERRGDGGGDQAQAAQSRLASPATRVASTKPMAASAPIAFQYVSGCSSRPSAVCEWARWIALGSRRPESP